MKKETTYLRLMPLAIMAAWFFVFGGTARAATLPIETDTVWTKEQSPIIINDYIWLKPGINLTIEKGAIIKFSSSGMLIISGKLIAIGVKTEPIIFTSIKDDANGGDSNQDGMAASPQPGDWSSLTINSGGEANLDYTAVQYGGSSYYSCAIINHRGKLTINHSVIAKNNAGIKNSQGILTISNSSIINNLAPFSGSIRMDIGIANNGQANIIVNAINNWWGTADGPCAWRLLPSADVKSICGNRPLVDSGVVYSPWLAASPDEPAKPDPVIIAPGIMGSWEVNGQWKLDPILHTYDNLWQAMKNAGYEEDKNLFAFPYEWRQDNTLTAYQLKQKIDEVKNICNCGKVDIVAHSMGGLVARAYAESDYYGNDIDQLVFLGAPHKGSPKSYYTWEAGEGFDSLLEKIVKLYLSQEAHNRGYNSLFDYIQNYVKSVEQLLPDYAYLQNSGDTIFRIYDQANYPNNYPYNAFLENINSAAKINQLNNSGIKMKNFIGDTGDHTINAIKVSSGEPYWPMWKNGYAEESIRLTGDGTVPEISSSLFVPTKIDNAEHLALPTKAQKQVIQYLTGNLPATEITDIKMPNVLLLVRIFSPADFLITAPDGQKLGKDFLSGQTVNEIPGAFYSGFNTDAEFAVIPDPLDGEYKVDLQGTGEGEYKLSVSLIDDNQQIDQEFSGSIISGQPRDFNISYSAASENPLSDLAPVDTVPPVVVINKPVEADKYLHSDNLIIDYTATDDFSGLATTTIMIDGQAVSTTTVDLFDYSLGMHNLTVKAIDKAGNQAEAQVNFEIIANIDSTISDIKETYERGWLTDKVYKKLLKDAFKLLKIETEYFDKEQKLNEKLNRKTQDDRKLTDKQKQKLLEQYDRKLAELKRNRQKAINKSLDLIIKLLDKAKAKNQLNQLGYDIILSDINYLRENL